MIAPDDLMLRLNRSLVLIDLGQLPEAESKIAGFLDHADATDMTRAMCRNALAYYAAIKGHIGEARDQFNAMPEAIRRSPFIKGTWGIIDCLGGRPQSALRILKAAYNTSLTPAAAASYMGWLALCYIELGDVDKADKCLAKARPQFRGDVYSVKRAKARLAGGTDVAETEASNIADVTSNEGEGPVSDSHP